jgi:V/A-type H+/Na+-transporting ATPase subunit E
MTTIEDKIKLFVKIIYEKIDETKEKEILEFSKEKELRLQELKLYIKNKNNETLSESLKRAEIKAAELITSQKIKAYQEVLTLKQKFIKETVELIKKKFQDFVQSEYYKEFLLEIIESNLASLEKAEYTVLLTPKDFKLYGEMIKFSGQKQGKVISIAVTKKDIIGGYLIEYKSGKFRIENSFAAKLSEFQEFIGLQVMNLLDRE